MGKGKGASTKERVRYPSKSGVPPLDGTGPMEKYDPKDEYIRVEAVQQHWTRRKLISQKYPEVLNFPTYHTPTAFWVVALVSALMITAKMMENASFLTILLVSYVFGATVSHALWVLIHELTHDLVFKEGTMNSIFLLIADLPHLIPAGVSFRHYHRLHHSFLNETYTDPDVPIPYENSILGHSPLGKAIWFCFYSIVIALRSAFYPLKDQSPFGIWMVLNYICNIAFTYLMSQWVGTWGMVYLILSSLMSVGFLMHPLGARWIAEHFAVTQSEQETYSTYGIINTLGFNIGYHNEHHDFVRVPWIYLPRLTSIASEYYTKGLRYHTSYWRVLYEFLNQDDFTFNSRVVRNPKQRVD
ncbi:sphingolipid delta 4 desaturase [Heterostelium album PN500]|uniref:Sphingolipid delta 4 desaturase n=1 Tax=Heterostelium pallidum (strain ATCC 26659 / Pp 5 / PN500) TaxID=670386 RepID=D3BD72_HETP5|nr:sphingolipid delta 4 desaturase [Heterostelium album PN500]EFA80864.1 sphingolipid delta 4 desaturase [Heterostelium album PN500]|eukprot:XP_020432983.1 sphingolipid delta 4 desaturase [Heterostelium album PN500]